MAQTRRDRGQAGPVDEFDRHDGPASESPGDIERMFAAQDDDLQGGRQLAFDFHELPTCSASMNSSRAAVSRRK